MNKRCIIIGAGHAAAQLAISLRSEGWEGDILILGEESSEPYQRPPLSKAYLSGELSADKMLIRPVALYEKKQVTLKLNCRVVSIDKLAKTVTTEQGEKLTYHKLCLATGTRARQFKGMPSANLEGIFYLRTMQDIDNIIQALGGAKHVAIVGGGYIGLETAASLLKKGLQVTVIEATDRILQRVTAPVMSEFFAQVHQEEGVTIIEGVGLSEFIGKKNKVSGIKLSNGNAINADIVIVGIGVEVNDELAVACDLEVDNGIVVDEYCQTSDPDILALGDCSNHFNAHYGRRIRLESVPNANEQAKTVAKTMTGKKEPYNSLPWFWSDQYDVKLQIAGLSQGFDQIVLRGDISSRSFCVYYLLSGVVIAADAINRPKDFMLAKKLILEKSKLPESDD